MHALSRQPALALRLFALTMLMLVSSFGEPTWADHGKDIAELDLGQLLDNVVLSASKHEETLAEAPANVFLITRRMIEQYGFGTIGEALSIVPGMYITNDYVLSQVGVRGVSFFGDWNSRVMVLVDGRPIGEQYGGTNSIDVPGITIDQVDRIEVIKGPASSLYGSNAFLGIINLITRNPLGNSATISSRYLAGTDAKSTDLRWSYRRGADFAIQSTASFTDQGGSHIFFPEFSDPTDSSLFSAGEDGFNQFYVDSNDFTGGVSYHKNTLDNLSMHHRIRWKDWALTLHYGLQNTGVPGSFYGSLFNRRDNEVRQRRHYVDLTYHRAVYAHTELTTRLAYDYYFWADHVLYNYSSEESDPAYLPGPLWIDNEYDRFVSGEVRAKSDLGRSDILVVGAELQAHDTRQESGEADAGKERIAENVIPPEDRETQGQIYNVYGQYEHVFSPWLQAAAGLHFNHHTYTTGRVTPKAALIVQPYATGTYKLIASQGFRSPTFYELTFDDGQFFIDNPDLKPELITSVEFLSAQEFPYGISLDVAANHSWLDDLILQTVIDQSDPAYPGGSYNDEISQFRNTGKMQTTSIEVAIRRHSAYRLSWFANTTFQELWIADQSSSEPFNSPRWLANAGVAYQLIRGKATASLRASHVSSRTLWDGSTLAARTVLDANLNVTRLFKVAELSVGVRNLTGLHYAVPLGYDYAPSTKIQQPGRSFHFGLSVSIGR